MLVRMYCISCERCFHSVASSGMLAAFSKSVSLGLVVALSACVISLVLGTCTSMPQTFRSLSLHCTWVASACICACSLAHPVARLSLLVVVCVCVLFRSPPLGKRSSPCSLYQSLSLCTVFVVRPVADVAVEELTL